MLHYVNVNIDGADIRAPKGTSVLGCMPALYCRACCKWPLKSNYFLYTKRARGYGNQEQHGKNQETSSQHC